MHLIVLATNCANYIEPDGIGLADGGGSGTELSLQ